MKTFFAKALIVITWILWVVMIGAVFHFSGSWIYNQLKPEEKTLIEVEVSIPQFTGEIQFTREELVEIANDHLDEKIEVSEWDFPKREVLHFQAYKQFKPEERTIHILSKDKSIDLSIVLFLYFDSDGAPRYFIPEVYTGKG